MTEAAALGRFLARADLAAINVFVRAVLGPDFTCNALTVAKRSLMNVVAFRFQPTTSRAIHSLVSRSRCRSPTCSPGSPCPSWT